MKSAQSTWNQADFMKSAKWAKDPWSYFFIHNWHNFESRFVEWRVFYFLKAEAILAHTDNLKFKKIQICMQSGQAEFDPGELTVKFLV